MEFNKGIVRGSSIEIPGGETSLELLRVGDAVMSRCPRTGTIIDSLVSKLWNITVESVVEFLFEDIYYTVPFGQFIMSDAGKLRASEVTNKNKIFRKVGDKVSPVELVAVKRWWVLVPATVIELREGGCLFANGVQLVLN